MAQIGETYKTLPAKVKVKKNQTLSDIEEELGLLAGSMKKANKGVQTVSTGQVLAVPTNYGPNKPGTQQYSKPIGPSIMEMQQYTDKYGRYIPPVASAPIGPVAPQYTSPAGPASRPQYSTPVGPRPPQYASPAGPAPRVYGPQAPTPAYGPANPYQYTSPAGPQPRIYGPQRPPQYSAPIGPVRTQAQYLSQFPSQGSAGYQYSTPAGPQQQFPYPGANSFFAPVPSNAAYTGAVPYYASGANGAVPGQVTYNGVTYNTTGFGTNAPSTQPGSTTQSSLTAQSGSTAGLPTFNEKYPPALRPVNPDGTTPKYTGDPNDPSTAMWRAYWNYQATLPKNMRDSVVPPKVMSIEEIWEMKKNARLKQQGENGGQSYQYQPDQRQQQPYYSGGVRQIVWGA